MCLAIPGRVVRWVDTDPISGVAEVEFGGVRRECHMACVPEAAVGDFVIVHAGVALSIIDAAEADRVLAELASLPDDDRDPEADESGPAEAVR
jgi:hydrogenase expression/formation protein HypC